MAQQFRELRDGDRFWFENAENGLTEGNCVRHFSCPYTLPPDALFLGDYTLTSELRLMWGRGILFYTFRINTYFNILWIKKFLKYLRRVYLFMQQFIHSFSPSQGN